jgi:hypothetical protein
VTLDEEWDALMATDPPEFPELPSGVDLALLARDTADCVSTFLATGSLDPEQRGTLRACGSELRAALPSLSGPPAAYLSKLAELSAGILFRVDRNRATWLS